MDTVRVDRCDEQLLWARITAHNPGGAQSDGFLRRIAREQRWSQNFARAAIAEYKKFCFLAAISPTQVTPSKQVDDVWHLHLLYSRDYWTAWCPLLGATLHHDPADPTPESQQTCHAQYAQTLALYERIFGPPPPAHWPATHRVFSRPPLFHRLLGRAK